MLLFFVTQLSTLTYTVQVFLKIVCGVAQMALLAMYKKGRRYLMLDLTASLSAVCWSPALPGPAVSTFAALEQLKIWRCPGVYLKADYYYFCEFLKVDAIAAAEIRPISIGKISTMGSQV